MIISVAFPGGFLCVIGFQKAKMIAIWVTMVRTVFSRLKFDKTEIFIIRFKLNKGDRGSGRRQPPGAFPVLLAEYGGKIDGKFAVAGPPEEHLLYTSQQTKIRQKMVKFSILGKKSGNFCYLYGICVR